MDRAKRLSAPFPRASRGVANGPTAPGARVRTARETCVTLRAQRVGGGGVVVVGAHSVVADDAWGAERVDPSRIFPR